MLTFPAFNHDQSGDAEAEYDRLRDLARQEASKRGQCFERVCVSPRTVCAAGILGLGVYTSRAGRAMALPV